MSVEVTIADLGLGNLHSVEQALVRAGARPRRVADPSALRDAERIVVPGQGAFGHCVDQLEAGFGEAILDWLPKERPYLGICLGMQLLFERSEEAPERCGLGILQGEVVRFRSPKNEAGRPLKVPHIGWSPIELIEGPAGATCSLLDERGWYYFVHSYHCVPRGNVSVATATYGDAFCAAVQRGPLFACQFHPEKSQQRGARLLERFMAT